jgi:hypothetical protein
MDILNIMKIVRRSKGGRGGYPWRRSDDNATGSITEKFFTKSPMIFRLVRSISGFRYDQKHMIREVPSGRGWAKSRSVGWSPTIGGRARMLEVFSGIAHV